jgi:hypothetical protein
VTRSAVTRSPRTSVAAIRRRAPSWERLALAAVVLVATVVTARYALRNHLPQPDEFLTIVGGRTVEADFPGALWQNDLIGRGPERLASLVTAAVSPDGASGFQAIHIVMAFLLSLSAVPAFALARGIGVPAPMAVAAAAIAVLTPWAVFGTTLLNTPLAVATSAFVLWAMWWSVLHPGARGDLLVVLAFVLVTTARVGHTPLVLAMAPAVLAHVWHTRPPGEPVAAWLRRAPGRIARAHPLLVALAAIGVAAIAVKGQSGLLGSYGSQITDQHLALDRLWLQVRTILARSAEALAIVPVLVAVPWVLREAVRPARPETGAFATLALGLFAILLYVLYSGAIEDRYIAPLAVPVAVAFAAGLTVRRVGVIGVAVTAVVVGRAIATVGAPADDSPFSYFVAAGAQFFHRAIALRVSTLPVVDDAVTLCVLVAGAAAVAVALLLRRGVRHTAAITAAVVLVVTAAGSVYAMSKWTTMATFPYREWTNQTFIDNATHGAPAAYFAIPSAEPDSPDVRARLLQAHFYNRDFRGTIVPEGEQTVFYCCPPRPLAPAGVRIDPARGTVRVLEGTVPRFVVVPAGFWPMGLAGRDAGTGEPALRVQELAPGPPRLAFAFRGGTTPGGWMGPGATIRIRTFPHAVARSRVCLRASVTAPPEGGRPIDYVLRTGAGRASGRLAPGASAAVRAPLPDAARADVTVRSSIGRLGGGQRAGVLVGDVALAPC